MQVNRTGVKTTPLVAMVIEKVVVPFLIYCSAQKGKGIKINEQPAASDDLFTGFDSSKT